MLLVHRLEDLKLVDGVGVQAERLNRVNPIIIVNRRVVSSELWDYPCIVFLVMLRQSDLHLLADLFHLDGDARNL